jgi:RNA polymerase sigma-70 factor (ECF subfamily)
VTPAEVQDLYERFGASVFARCSRLLRSRAAAEDVLQDVFVRVIRYGHGFRGGSTLSWLHRIADRACLDRLRRDGAPAPLDGEGQGPAEGSEASSQALPTPEASRLLAELLSSLPEKLREIAILSFVDDLTQEEIAQTLGCSTMTVKRRLRALREHAGLQTGGGGALEVPDAKLEP